MLFLTPDEVVRLTGKVQKAAQEKRLKLRKIPYEDNGHELLVSRAFIEKRLDTNQPEVKSSEPNFGFLNEKAQRHTKSSLLASQPVAVQSTRP